MDKELVKNIRQFWIEQLFDLSHEKAQTMIPSDPKMVGWTFTEAVGMYFDSLGLSDGYRDFIEQGYVTAEEAEIWKDCHQKFKEYIRPEKLYLSDDKILRDPEWKIIQCTGYEAWIKFIAIVTDKEEKDLIESLEKQVL